MKENTTYQGFEASSSVIIWFWEIMSEFEEIDKANFLFFLTGNFIIIFSSIIIIDGIYNFKI